MLETIRNKLFPIKRVIVHFHSVQAGSVVITKNEYDPQVWELIKSWYLVHVPYDHIQEIR